MRASKSTPGQIATTVDDNVGQLTIDSPQRRNALGLAMYESIPGAIAELVEAEVRVIVIRGAGEQAFCAGSDISEFATMRTPTNWRIYADAEHHAHEAVTAAPMPTIAAIHGFCRGGGLALAMCCDLRFAADDATFAVPPGNLGIGYPPEGLGVLSEIVGMATAKDLVLTARVVDAAEALDMDLVTRVIAKSSLDNDVLATAKSISLLAPLTLRAAKFALTDLGRPLAQRSPERVNELWKNCYASNDYAEGIRAFAAGQKPEFEGR